MVEVSSLSLLDRYLSRGWKIIPLGKNGTRKAIKCPQAGCGLTLTVSSQTRVSKDADEVGSISELSKVIADRRLALGLTADDVDHVAGLAARHTQKIEDSGSRMVQLGFRSGEQILEAALKADEDPNAKEALDILAARGISRTTSTIRRRFATFDTILLVVTALGGRIKIEWGKPPRLAQRLSKLAQYNRQSGLWD